jgi:hypothetical protein
METKETLLETIHSEKILHNEEYFKHIFKKTEKIACAVFYILRSDTDIARTDTVVLELEYAAQTALKLSIESLKSTAMTVSSSVEALRFSLIELESYLRIAHATRYISDDVLGVFMHEIDSVYRSIRKYSKNSAASPFNQTLGSSDSSVAKRAVRARISSENGAEPRQVQQAIHQSRRERILSFLKDNTEATIKDISEVVTDCSEKTIQRELTALISDNVIVREGERRWSKYRLI